MAGKPNQPGIPHWCGDALRIRRLAAGWSVSALAEHVGTTKSTLTRWEHSDNAPQAVYVKRLAKTLKVKPTAFARTPKIS